MYDLRAFVPSEECLKCDRCCRFAEQDSIWNPVFSAGEVEEIINSGIAPSVFNIGRVGFKDVRIKAQEISSMLYACPFFNVDKNCCNVYPLRPFDCRLYPFLLVQMDEGLILGVDEECPYVRKILERDDGCQVIERHAKYLADFLQSEAGAKIIGERPQMPAPYRGKIRMLAPLD